MKTYCVVHVVALNKEGKYLIVQRAKGGHVGEWRPITGHIKEREAAEDAALRELKEETGLEGEIIKTVDPFWVDTGDRRWLTVAFVLKVDNEEEIKIDKSEILDCKWVDDDSPLMENSIALARSVEELGITK